MDSVKRSGAEGIEVPVSKMPCIVSVNETDKFNFSIDTIPSSLGVHSDDWGGVVTQPIIRAERNESDEELLACLAKMPEAQPVVGDDDDKSVVDKQAVKGDEVTEQQSDVTEQQSDVADQQSDVTEQQSDVTERQSDVTDQESDVTEIDYASWGTSKAGLERESQEWGVDSESDESESIKRYNMHTDAGAYSGLYNSVRLFGVGLAGARNAEDIWLDLMTLIKDVWWAGKRRSKHLFLGSMLVTAYEGSRQILSSPHYALSGPSSLVMKAWCRRFFGTLTSWLPSMAPNLDAFRCVQRGSKIAVLSDCAGPFFENYALQNAIQGSYHAPLTLPFMGKFKPICFCLLTHQPKPLDRMAQSLDRAALDRQFMQVTFHPKTPQLQLVPEDDGGLARFLDMLLDYALKMKPQSDDDIDEYSEMIWNALDYMRQNRKAAHRSLVRQMKDMHNL